MKKFAVILSGNGVFDGSDIHEATMTLYAIALHGFEYQVFAPDVDQHHVVNHITGEEMPEVRNVLVEAARIARGKIEPLSQLNPADYDAIVFPGGFGAAKNLSSFAFDGPDCSINPDVERAIKGMHKLGKPIGALCIAPVLLARVLEQGELTIGNDPGTAQAIESMGVTHTNTQSTGVVVDTNNNLFTTPCYMLADSIVDVAEGTKNLIEAMVRDLGN